MSTRYEQDMARRIAAQATDPATIAAGTREHERQQRERRQHHNNLGQRLISQRRAVLAERIERLEQQLAEMQAEWAQLKTSLARGQLSTEDYRERARELMAARERIPEEINLVVADLEAADGLDPIEASSDFLNRFPALSSRIGGVIPPLPERNGHSNGDGD